MKELTALFAQTRQENRAALVGYLPAGFPDQQTSIAAITTMIESGVDAIEVGLPYSDPVMDGPVVQAAADTALAGGTRIADVLDVVRASARLAPTVVMTYYNPVFRYGVARFAAELAAAGGQGIITPDLIPDEADEWISVSQESDLARIFLVAPSSTDERLAMTAAASTGFVYAGAVMGVTGLRTQSSALAPELVRRLRDVTDLPVAVGLGISNGEQAHEVARYADAVIVGSAMVRCLQSADDAASGLADLSTFCGELREAVERS